MIITTVTPENPCELQAMRPQISVMTAPVPRGRYFFKEPLKQLAKKIRGVFIPRPAFLKSKYGGNFQRTRSTVEGLQKIGVNVNYNPIRKNEVGEVLYVPSCFDALRQAIQMKRSGFIRRLLAGPNLVEFPTDSRELIAAAEIDVYIVPDHTSQYLYIQDCPELNGRCRTVPTGVDTDYWQPAMARGERPNIVIYIKQFLESVNPDEIISWLMGVGYRVEILRYGSYTHGQFLQALQQAKLMVGFTRSESQGVAWSEAWSADVPTLIVRNEIVTHRHKTYRCSTAPYLSDQTGMFFNDLQDFKLVFKNWEMNQDKFNPRQWVLDNLSDEKCAEKLCKLAEI
ncbi:MAG: hypothetical protein P8168_04230 [Deltaproteobacteria bacterium]|jgi:hypothetical protein